MKRRTFLIMSVQLLVVTAGSEFQPAVNTAETQTILE